MKHDKVAHIPTATEQADYCLRRWMASNTFTESQRWYDAYLRFVSQDDTLLVKELAA